jgi:hypothetical protein
MTTLFPPESEVVGEIHAQLAHLEKIHRGFPGPLGYVQVLTREQISLLVETAFWASLRPNEGRTTRVRAAAVARENTSDAVSFATPVAYDEVQIAKLAPAIPSGGCLAVSGVGNGLTIWGYCRTRPRAIVDPVMVEVSEPGTVRVNVGPFEPFAVLNGRANPVIQGTRTNLAVYVQRALRKVIPTEDIIETQAVWRECLALADLARQIVGDGHGGLILIVPGETGSWSESISPFPYRFATPDTTIRDLIRKDLNDGVARAQVLQRLADTPMPDDLKNLTMGALAINWGGMDRGVRGAASLAAVDGAIVVTRDLEVLGFGGKIAVGNGIVPKVCLFRAEPGKQEVIPSPLEDLGGTRHQSAARFVAANRESVALVVSQDRHVSVAHWDTSLECVSVLRNAEWWV